MPIYFGRVPWIPQTAINLSTGVQNMEKIGVVLLNLGGPETLADVEPFLFNLFSDRKIIRLGPAFLQKPIAWWIAKKRAPKSREYYRLIGSGSPLSSITMAQGAALEVALKEAGIVARVSMAMRYWKPYAPECLASLRQEGIRRVIALTLYPHYSIATTGSSMDDLSETAKNSNFDFDLAEIREWPANPYYIEALAETVREGMAAMSEDYQLLYSAHSLPVQFIAEGDPYVEHLQQTIGALEKLTGKKGMLCYQSRSGPVKWLEPSTPDTITRLAEGGCRQLLVVPISFVSDHVETLYEIDIQYAQLAKGLGVHLQRTPSLNVRPLFISALKNLVIDAAARKGWT